MSLTFAEAKQLELLKKMRPVDRFLLMTQLINAQFEIMIAGIKYRNPNISESELAQCLKSRMEKIYSMKL